MREWVGFQRARWRKRSGRKSAPRSRLRRARILRLKAAVTPGGVVVGGEQGGDGFGGAGCEVGAEQQGVAGSELGAEAGEDLAGFGGGEVADAGADVEGENAGVGRALDADGVGDVVGDAWADGDTGDGEFDLGAGLVECGGADVDGLVEDVRLRPQRARSARGGCRFWRRCRRRVRRWCSARGRGGMPVLRCRFRVQHVRDDIVAELRSKISAAWAVKRARSVRVR